MQPGVVVTYPVSPYSEERDGGLYVVRTGCVPQLRGDSLSETCISGDNHSVVSNSQAIASDRVLLGERENDQGYIAEGERELEQSSIPLSGTNPELLPVWRLLGGR
jgi:hypothetical protein